MATTSQGSTPRQIGLRRRLLQVIAVAAALVALMGCGANFSAQTNQIYQPGDGADYRQGDMYIVNGLVATDGLGNGTIVASVINQADTDDALVSISAVDSNGGNIKSAPLSTPIPLPRNAPGSAVDLSKEGLVRISSKSLTAGYYVTVTFTFENAEPVELEMPILDNTTIYSSVPVGPISSTK